MDSAPVRIKVGEQCVAAAGYSRRCCLSSGRALSSALAGFRFSLQYRRLYFSPSASDLRLASNSSECYTHWLADNIHVSLDFRILCNLAWSLFLSLLGRKKEQVS
jgi:hypothetical protein